MLIWTPMVETLYSQALIIAFKIYQCVFPTVSIKK